MESEGLYEIRAQLHPKRPRRPAGAADRSRERRLDRLALLEDHTAENANIPEFHRYSTAGQVPLGQSLVGFLLEGPLDSRAPAAAPISMYPYPVSGRLGTHPKRTIDPIRAISAAAYQRRPRILVLR